MIHNVRLLMTAVAAIVLFAPAGQAVTWEHSPEGPVDLGILYSNATTTQSIWSIATCTQGEVVTGGLSMRYRVANPHPELAVQPANSSFRVEGPLACDEPRNWTVRNDVKVSFNRIADAQYPLSFAIEADYQGETYEWPMRIQPAYEPNHTVDIRSFVWEATPGQTFIVKMDFIHGGNAPLSVRTTAQQVTSYRATYMDLVADDRILDSVLPGDSAISLPIVIRGEPPQAVGYVNRTIAINVTFETEPAGIPFAEYFRETRVITVHVKVRQGTEPSPAEGGSSPVPVWATLLAVGAVAMRRRP